jgi:PiT family inorganic phosphate transporter
MTIYIVLLILLALFFDFLNGFHDSANSIATIVSTRVLSPKYAVIWAAFFNFIAFLFLGLHVANTIGKGIIDVGIIDAHIIFATLVGACLWDILTWYLGLPTSSSHALIGGMVGAALVKAGPESLVAAGIIKTVAFIFAHGGAPPRPDHRDCSLLGIQEGHTTARGPYLPQGAARLRRPVQPRPRRQ